MPRIRRRTTRIRLGGPIPDALRAYWARHSARMRRRMAVAADPASLPSESINLRAEQAADDDAIAADGLDWHSRRERGEA